MPIHYFLSPPTIYHISAVVILMQRDLFSAFLGLFVNQEGNLSVEEARNSYPRLEPVLKAAWTEFHQRLSANGKCLFPDHPERSVENVCDQG